MYVTNATSLVTSAIPKGPSISLSIKHERDRSALSVQAQPWLPWQENAKPIPQQSLHKGRSSGCEYTPASQPFSSFLLPEELRPNSLSSFSAGWVAPSTHFKISPLCTIHSIGAKPFLFSILHTVQYSECSMVLSKELTEK